MTVCRPRASAGSVGRLFVAVALLAGMVRGADEKASPPAAPPATRPATAPATPWRSLFDGKTLDGWEPTGFGGQGEPAVENGTLVLPSGVMLTGVTYTGDVPRTNYEVSFDAKRVDGSDFFCGLTFPVGDSYATLVVGGWGGSLCGISSLDGEDAAHNETKTNLRIVADKWYRIRLRVQPEHLTAWVDQDKIIDVNTKGKKIALRIDIDQGKPFGLASFQTTAAYRDIKIRTLGEGEK